MKKKLTFMCLMLCSMTILFTTDVNAAYIYSQYNSVISSAEAMTVKKVINSNSILDPSTGKTVTLGELYDIFVYTDKEVTDGSQDRIYLLDSSTKVGYTLDTDTQIYMPGEESTSVTLDYTVSTGKIICLDMDFKLISQYPSLEPLSKEDFRLFTSVTGENGYLNTPQGIYVTKDYVYVADTNNNRIFNMTHDLKLLNADQTELFLKPDDQSFDTYAFKPTKFVVAENTGRVYSVASGIYEGIVDFSKAKYQSFDDSYSFARGNNAFFRYVVASKEVLDSKSLNFYDGDVYFDASTHKRYEYKNSQWLESLDYSAIINDLAWVLGEGTPTNSVKQGAFYLDTTNLDVYQFNSSWNLLGKLFKTEKTLTESGEVATTSDGTKFIYSEDAEYEDSESGDLLIDRDLNIYRKSDARWVKLVSINSSSGSFTASDEVTDSLGNKWLYKTKTPTTEDSAEYYVFTNKNENTIYRKTESGWEILGCIGYTTFVNEGCTDLLNRNIYTEEKTLGADEVGFAAIFDEENKTVLMKEHKASWTDVCTISYANNNITYETVENDSNDLWINKNVGAPKENPKNISITNYYLDASNDTIYEYGSNGWTKLFALTNNQADYFKEEVVYLNGNKIFTGKITPNDSFGENGDYYFNYLTGIVYMKTSSGWDQLVVLKDLDGNYLGENGLIDTLGHKWYTGNTLPVNDTFYAHGDYYYDYRLGDIFKYVNGVWTKYGNISTFVAKQGNFSRYYGSNSVGSTNLWSLLKSASQRAASGVKIQTTFNNLTIDEIGYIYTVSPKSSGLVIKKLNFTGKDVLRNNSTVRPAGELVTQMNNTDIPSGSSTLVDISINSWGSYSALDAKFGRVYTYDFEGNLLYIFGERGSQDGSLYLPTGLAAYQDEFFVTDRSTKSVVVYTPTEFTKAVNKASEAYYNGDYESAANYWEVVLDYNTNYFLAYTGIGKSQFRNASYENAMHNFKKGYDRINYSRAYKEYRANKLEKIFPFILGAVCILIVYGIGKGLYKQYKEQKSDDGGDL